ncbi:hypothetical protein VNO80_09584 [Phaseolus coccineus]|uniref:Uncharacterized protein n=1 Tax=Phaseolus coccineus TaxID=3886 RepID=A0AAN9NBV8_PHACN
MSLPGDARMPRALAMPHASLPGDVRMPRALAMPHASRSGDARMPHALAMPDYTSPRLAEEIEIVRVFEREMVLSFKRQIVGSHDKAEILVQAFALQKKVVLQH